MQKCDLAPQRELASWWFRDQLPEMLFVVKISCTLYSNLSPFRKDVLLQTKNSIPSAIGRSENH